jgi:hypothetical protein
MSRVRRRSHVAADFVLHSCIGAQVSPMQTVHHLCHAVMDQLLSLSLCELARQNGTATVCTAQLPHLGCCPDVTGGCGRPHGRRACHSSLPKFWTFIPPPLGALAIQATTSSSPYLTAPPNFLKAGPMPTRRQRCSVLILSPVSSPTSFSLRNLESVFIAVRFTQDLFLSPPRGCVRLREVAHPYSSIV